MVNLHVDLRELHVMPETAIIEIPTAITANPSSSNWDYGFFYASDFLEFFEFTLPISSTLEARKQKSKLL